MGLYCYDDTPGREDHSVQNFSLTEEILEAIPLGENRLLHALLKEQLLKPSTMNDTQIGVNGGISGNELFHYH